MRDAHTIKPDDFKQGEYSEYLEIKEVGDEIDPWWGLGAYTISQEQIDALNAGKVLYASVNYEYAILIKKEGKE